MPQWRKRGVGETIWPILSCLALLVFSLGTFAADAPDPKPEAFPKPAATKADEPLAAKLSLTKAGEYLDMPDLLRALAKSGRTVHCHEENCFWLDIGRAEDFAQAQTIYDNDPRFFT